MGKSIASLAFEGVRDLLKFGSKGLAAGAKGSGKIFEYSQASKVMANHPFRTISSIGALGASVGLAGFGGVGPMSSLGDWYTKNTIAEYGDRPETMKTITATQTSATLGAIGAGLLGGAGLFGFGPLATNYSKMASSFGKGSIGLVKKTGSLLNKVDQGAAKVMQKVGNKTIDYLNNPEWIPKSTQKKVSSFAKGAFARKFSVRGSDDLNAYASGFAIRKYPKKTVSAFGQSASSWTKKRVDSAKNHPLLWGTALGFAAGAGIATADDNYERLRGGSEGDITGIGSTPQGGISPELQFSTYDLMFALHRNNKSIKTRYQ